MVKMEFRWFVWLFAALLIYMVYKSPGTMAWTAGSALHGFADVGSGLVRGLHGIQTCGKTCHR